MTRKPSKQPLAILVIILLAIGLLFLGTYFGKFSFVATPEPASWPRIYKLYVKEIKHKEWPFDSTLETIDYEYQILKRVQKTPSKWEREDAPIVKITRSSGPYGPYTLYMRPSLWEYEHKGDYVIFKFDPDEEDMFAPDLMVAVKFLHVKKFSEVASTLHAPMMMIPVDGGGGAGGGGGGSGGDHYLEGRDIYSRDMVAFYEVRFVLASKHSSEIPNYYAGSKLIILMDAYYLYDYVIMNNALYDVIIDDRTGLTKIELPIPEHIPEVPPGDVDFFRYLFNLPSDAKILGAVRVFGVAYDPNVIVTGATKIVWPSLPEHTGPGTTFTTTETEWITTKESFTIPISITTTIKITEWTTVTYPTTYTQKHTYTLTQTGLKYTTIVKTVTKTKTEEEPICLIRDVKTGKCIVPLWMAIAAGAGFMILITMILAITLSHAGRRARTRPSSHRRRTSRRRR